MRRLNGVDALMLYLDGGSAYNHTLKISVLDPSTDPDGWSWPKARQMFEERAHLLPVFRLRYLPTPLGLHHPIWVEDPEFDLDAHVRRVVCPAPGGMAEFCALVEQIYAHPLDRDRPLWQTWVVEGLDGGRVALVTLLHHAYSDGVGVLDMLAAFYNDTPDEAPVVAPPWSRRRCRPPGNASVGPCGTCPPGSARSRRPCGPFVIGCASNGSSPKTATGASRPRSTAPHRRARFSAGCRAAGGSPANRSRSPRFAR